jgi:hypothetical protein
MSSPSRKQMDEWDKEYEDYIDDLIRKDFERQIWEGMKQGDIPMDLRDLIRLERENWNAYSCDPDSPVFQQQLKEVQNRVDDEVDIAMELVEDEYQRWCDAIDEMPINHDDLEGTKGK